MIHKFEELTPLHPNGNTIFYIQGYGGRMWHAKRHLKILLNAGYHVYYFDLYDVLKRGDPNELIQLVDEVDRVVKSKNTDPENSIFIGISLGGLIGYNLLKRHKEYKKLIVITGGDITHLASLIYLRKNWHIDKKTLDKLWNEVNIYTEVGKLNGKSIVMLLPKRDKIINPQEVIEEINRHEHLNNVTLIKTRGGHYRTIVSETISHPKRTLGYIDKVIS